MKEKVDRKWRKKHPEQHKSYGEKRQRDEKKIIEEEKSAGLCR